MRRVSSLVLIVCAGMLLPWWVLSRGLRATYTAQERETTRYRAIAGVGLLGLGYRLNEGERDWLRSVAGWSDGDIDFLHRYFAVPLGAGRFQWAFQRPTGWSEYCEIVDRAAEVGGTYEGLALSRHGPGAYGGGLWADAMFPPRMTRFERMSLVDGSRVWLTPIIENLGKSDYSGARAALHGVGNPVVSQSSTARN